MRHEMDCHVEPMEREVDPAALERARRIYLAVAGMGCPNCAHRVRNSLLSVPGVVEARVEASRATAAVWYDPERASVQDLLAGVARAGQGSHHDYMAVPIHDRFATTPSDS